MKKLFLQSGKLMCGEFPEEPEICPQFRVGGMDCPNSNENGCACNAAVFTHEASVSAAKDCAVEVPEMESGKINIAPTFNSNKMGWWMDGEIMQEGQLYDTPEGWKVEIEDYRCPRCGYTYEDAKQIGDHHLCSEKTFPANVKIARLIPLKESISKYQDGKGNDIPKQSGIAAVGLPEYGELEKPDHTMKCNVCGEVFDRSNLTSVILHEHDGKEETAAQALGIKGKKVEAGIPESGASL